MSALPIPLPDEMWSLIARLCAVEDAVSKQHSKIVSELPLDLLCNCEDLYLHSGLVNARHSSMWGLSLDDMDEVTFTETGGKIYTVVEPDADWGAGRDVEMLTAVTNLPQSSINAIVDVAREHFRSTKAKKTAQK